MWTTDHVVCAPQSGHAVVAFNGDCLSLQTSISDSGFPSCPSSSRSSTWQPRSLRAARPTSPQSLWAAKACQISASAPISRMSGLKSWVRATRFLNSMQDCFWSSGKQGALVTKGTAFNYTRSGGFGFQEQGRLEYWFRSLFGLFLVFSTPGNKGNRSTKKTKRGFDC